MAIQELKTIKTDKKIQFQQINNQPLGRNVLNQIANTDLILFFQCMS